MLLVPQPEETTAETTKEEAETAAAEEPAAEEPAAEEAEAEEEEEEEEEEDEEPVDPKEQLEEGGFNPDAVTDSIVTVATPGRRDAIAAEEDEIWRAALSLCAMARAG
jgi:hypothetical protein